MLFFENVSEAELWLIISGFFNFIGGRWKSFLNSFGEIDSKVDLYVYKSELDLNNYFC